MKRSAIVLAAGVLALGGGIAAHPGPGAAAAEPVAVNDSAVRDRLPPTLAVRG